MAIRYSSSGGTPFGDSASRPSGPIVGQTYYNGELGYLEIYTSAGWIPASGGNDFNLNLSGIHTAVTFSQSYAAGSYSVTSGSNDTTIDIYAYAADGSLAGYSGTKSFTATKRFNKMVVIGGTNGDVLGFSYKTTYATTTSTTDVTSGAYITSITPSGMPNKNDTITITGGNFATDVAVSFTGTGYSSTAAKSIVRSSSTQLIVTRPDNFPTSAAPYTVTVTNPSVANQPTASASHQYSGITSGSSPVWQTSTTLASASVGQSYSVTLSATDVDGSSSITYAIVSGVFPTGLSLNSSTGAITGTPSGSDGTYTITISATDSGGNSTNRTFTLIQLTQINIEYLLIAGGGGPARDHAGGGGAGGLLTGTYTASIGNSFSFTIGAGGAGGTVASGGGNNGTNSTGFSFTAVGGGGTGNGNSSAGFSGGSGGGGNGAGTTTQAGGSGTAGQGYAGGRGGNVSGTTSVEPGGGGGGAGGPGQDAPTTIGGAGGIGFYNSLTNAMGAAVNAGQLSGGNYYFAGGGGGGTNSNNSTDSQGGLGGGGNGKGSTNVGANGTANTGGGAGSGGNGADSGNGGSGILIIRFPSTNTVSATTGSPTTITTGGYKYYKFTANGSITF